MDVKLIEIRDRATFIPAMAIRLRNRTPEEFFLLRRAGYGAEQIDGPEETPGTLVGVLEPYVILTRLSADGPANYDPHDWLDRTMYTAHMYVITHWATLKSGDVVDVEFINGETAAPKVSERTT